MAREKVPAEVSRKATQMAAKKLRENHAEEYADLIDWAYLEQGFKSPADRRRERLEAAAAKKAAAAERRAAREEAKIAEAKAFLRAKGIEVEDGEAEDLAESA